MNKEITTDISVNRMGLIIISNALSHYREAGLVDDELLKSTGVKEYKESIDNALKKDLDVLLNEFIRKLGE